MKTRINILLELSKRLDGGIPDSIAKRATAENGWFSPSDINTAIDAVRCDMLNQEALYEWVSHYPTLPTLSAQRVLIVMAGNIPLVGFFDILCVFMAGHHAYVKCSSKDRILMEYVISLILEIAPDATIYIGECENPDRVIATGGDGAVRHFKAKYPNIPTLLRGSRHSIAVLSGQDQEVNSLSEDIYMYSGLGCRSVSMIFVPKGYELKLATYNTHTKYRNNYLQSRALLTMMGKNFIDSGSSLLVKSDSFPTTLSTISIYEYDTLEEVERWIARNDNTIQCIVSNIITHSRQVGFGESQHPSLFDYADDVDTMNFLM